MESNMEYEFQNESLPSAPSLPSDSNDQPLAAATVGVPVIVPASLPHSPSPWSTGLCDCFEDLNSCCLTFWCPCITFGRIAEIVDRGSTSCGVSGTIYGMMMCMMGCSCLYSCCYRTRMRGQYYLEETPCADCCVHFCCEGCALCQEYRHLQNQGIDMTIGWYGNVHRQRRLDAMKQPPQFQTGMDR